MFAGTSVDGFIARAHGDFDFPPEGGGEPHGYNECIASSDAIVIGRKTFKKVLTLGLCPYVGKRVVVLSSRPLDLSAAVSGVVEQQLVVFSTSMWTVESRFDAEQQVDSAERGWFKNLRQGALR